MSPRPTPTPPDDMAYTRELVERRRARQATPPDTQGVREQIEISAWTLLEAHAVEGPHVDHDCIRRHTDAVLRAVAARPSPTAPPSVPAPSGERERLLSLAEEWDEDAAGMRGDPILEGVADGKAECAAALRAALSAPATPVD